MKKLEFAQSITVLANLGVIAGIVFLGFEIQQNNELLEAEARANREEVRRWAISRKLENPQLAAAMVRLESGEPLTEMDLYLLDLEVDASIMDWQNIHREFRAGLLDEDVMPIAAWRRIFHANPRYRAGWTPERRESLEPEFLEWMEEYIVGDPVGN